MDVLTHQNEGIEMKVGYKSLGDGDIKEQIAKDAWLLQNVDVNSMRWVFVPNAYGEGGASQPLLNALDQAGIQYTIGP